ncbi:MAG: hypothetical protein FJ137_14310 [Deltaproteobacteria bacterium]|nr:hypothetical protein [Deltaproteobacteria bacterium]
MKCPLVRLARWSAAVAAVAAGGAGVVGALGPATGCLSCRTVVAKPLAVECAASSTYRGELHFSDADAFRSFLTDRCLLPVDAADEVVAAVDFGVDGVFVARGPRFAPGRCVEARAVDEVYVCVGGLRVAFADDVTSTTPCLGDWTVAVALPRAELRAALADEPREPLPPG